MTFSTAFGGATSIADKLYGGQLQTTSSSIVTHSGTWGPTDRSVTLVVNHYTAPSYESVTVMAQAGMDLAYLALPSPRNCYLFGGWSGAPSCSSVGITYDRNAGLVSFANTPLDSGMTLSGSLSFPKF